MASMITTVDNPYDPRTHFKEWYAWDTAHGYNTSGYLARVALLPDGFPQEYENALIEAAMDEIIAAHAGGLYKKLPINEAA